MTQACNQTVRRARISRRCRRLHRAEVDLERNMEKVENRLQTRARNEQTSCIRITIPEKILKGYIPPELKKLEESLLASSHATIKRKRRQQVCVHRDQMDRDRLQKKFTDHFRPIDSSYSSWGICVDK